jgi:hypothetical protein
MESEFGNTISARARLIIPTGFNLGERRSIAQKRGAQRSADCGRIAEIKAPNSKLQHPEKLQAPNFKPRPVEVWSF